jgi:hypothetical protein
VKWSFTEHPAAVGESYLEHLRSAWGFAGSMMVGGIACFAHGILPFLFSNTGSSAIRRLHERMVVDRQRCSKPAGALLGVEQTSSSCRHELPTDEAAAPPPYA